MRVILKNTKKEERVFWRYNKFSASLNRGLDCLEEEAADRGQLSLAQRTSEKGRVNQKPESGKTEELGEGDNMKRGSGAKKAISK